MIHQTAVIHPKARVDASVEVGPYAVVDAEVEIGPGCVLGPYVYITGWTRIARETCFMLVDNDREIGYDPWSAMESACTARV